MAVYDTPPPRTRAGFAPRLLAVISYEGVAYQALADTDAETAACAPLEALVKPHLDAAARAVSRPAIRPRRRREGVA